MLPPTDFLSIRNLSIAFDTKKVLDGVSFSMAPNEIVGVVGESGSGKSLTSLALMGLLPANASVSGEIFFKGENILAFSEKERRKLRVLSFSMIFQEPMSSLNPSMTCGEQVLEVFSTFSSETETQNTKTAFFSSEIKTQKNNKEKISSETENHNKKEEKNGSLSRKQQKEKVIALFKKVKLPFAEATYNKYPHELSGGQKQRVMIAMAIASSPQLLIADEPTTALDTSVQKEIISLLLALQKETKMSIFLFRTIFIW